MPVHPPIVRRFVPPTEEQVAAAHLTATRVRAEVAAKRAVSHPLRRAAILAGPPLRDVDAAVECRCSCHPRTCDVDLHDGGQSCSCQDTDEQREARRKAFRDAWSALTDDFAEEHGFHEERQRLFDIEAADLGVEARIEIQAAPFVIVGTCDGRGFYLRERHGTYRVTIAADEDPGSDPWTAEPTESSIDVAGGDDDELVRDGRFSPAAALRIAVAAVRTALARNICVHQEVGSGPYCPACGAPLADAGAWRWT